MEIVCIKQYVDEYKFKYNPGEVFECEMVNMSFYKKHLQPYFIIRRPGQGPMGSLAITYVSKEYFVDKQQYRNITLENLLTIKNDNLS